MPIWMQLLMSYIFVTTGALGLIGLIFQDRKKQNNWTLVKIVYYFAYFAIGFAGIIYSTGP